MCFSLALDRNCASHEQKPRYHSSACTSSPFRISFGTPSTRAKLNEAVFIEEYAFLFYVYGISRSR